MKYAFIQQHAQEFPVRAMCQVLQVGRSGYYAWRSRPVSAQKMANETLLRQIRTVWQQSRQCYGSPRIYQALKRQGLVAGRHRIARLMRAQGWSARPRRRFQRTTVVDRSHPVAPNRLQRNFAATAPNQKWVGDITYIPTQEGWLYLAVLLDLFSRRVVGWAFSPTLEATLTQRALQMALRQRQPSAPLLHHSDRGSQYTAHAYQQVLQHQHLVSSMSATGNCYDNAAMESFFGRLKTECVHQENFQSRAQAQRTLFEYMEVFYNRQRLHSTLNYRTPIEFEQVYQTSQISPMSTF